MFKIGIVGSESSHALAFSKLANNPDESGNLLFPDFKVVSIFGLDLEQAKAVAAEANIATVCEDFTEMLNTVDAAMILFRDGNLHAQYAIPFIEKGIPLFIDKPFAFKTKDAIEIVHLAKKLGVNITGGSTCKYAKTILSLKQTVANGGVGEVLGGVMNFPANDLSDFGGLHFYAPHLCEMALTLFGYDVISVTAVQNNPKQITAVLKYGKFNVVLNFINDCPQYHMVIYGDKAAIHTEIDITDVYRYGFEQFALMLKTAQMPHSYHELVMPVMLVEAIEKSKIHTKEVFIEV